VATTSYVRDVLLLRAHKEVLFFASPFFEAALSGNWSETGRPPSMSSIITISQPPSVPGDKSMHEATEMTFAPMDPEGEPEELELILDVVRGDSVGTSWDESSIEGGSSSEAKAKAIDDSLAKLQSGTISPRASYESTLCEDSSDEANPPASPERSKVTASKKLAQSMSRKSGRNIPDAVIVLKEERVCSLAFVNCSTISRDSRQAHSTIS
jgi:hypothetical protein